MLEEKEQQDIAAAAAGQTEELANQSGQPVNEKSQKEEGYKG